MRLPRWLVPALGLLAVLAGGCTRGPVRAQTLTVTATELKFEPAALTVRAGQPVQVLFRNKGTAEHDFVITGMPARGADGGRGRGAEADAGEIAGHLKPGRATTIRFTPTTPGSYAFYCSLPGHREAGMQGTLTVE